MAAERHIVAYVCFDRLVSDADALAQLLQALDRHVARVTAAPRTTTADAHTDAGRQLTTSRG